MKLDTNKHLVFLLHYHLVLVTKYRKKVLMTPFQITQKRFLNGLESVVISRLKNGIMIKTMFTSFSKPIPIQNYQNLSTPIRAQVVGQ